MANADDVLRWVDRLGPRGRPIVIYRVHAEPAVSAVTITSPEADVFEGSASTKRRATAAWFEEV